MNFAKQDIDTIIANCKKENKKFTDESFPPKPVSLYFNGKKPGKTSVAYNEEQHDEKVYKWLRPSQLKTKDGSKLEWTVFRDPKGKDIVQGVLGNCWLMSSLAVLAEKEDYLRQLFPVDKYCETGVYEVRLCREGTWTLVAVDDMLPCGKYDDLIYSGSSRKQLWAPIIEKACAKLYGCYEALVAGKCIEGLSLLTGAPCESLNLQKMKHEEDPNHDVIWGQLISAQEGGHLMGASCGGGQMQVNEKAFNDVGLKARHAYSVLDVKMYKNHKLIRLRNPWGKNPWKGPWSDDSAEMKRGNNKQKLKANRGKEGVFWMEYDDLTQFFDAIDICRLNHDWVQTKINGILPSLASTQQHMGFITVSQSTEVVVTLFQKNNRHQNMEKCLDLLIVVCKCNPKTFAPLKMIAHSKRQLKSFVSVSHVFKPGSYLVVPMAFNQYKHDQQMPTKAKLKKMPKFTMTFHSMSQISVDRFYIGTYTIADSLYYLAHKKGTRHEARQGVTVYYLSGGFAGLIVMAENRDSDQFLQIKCNCEDSNNVVATRGELLTMDVIPPMHRQIIVVLSQLEMSNGHQINHKLTHRTSTGKDLANWADPGTTNKPSLTQAIWGLHAPRPL